MGGAQPPRQLQERPVPVALTLSPEPTGSVVARVLVDIVALDREFDYIVPHKMAAAVRPGTIVRVPLHGRRVRGWVTAVAVSPPEGVRLQPIAKVTGWGPPAELIDLAGWAAWRWAGRRTHFLRTASPPGAIGSLPAPPPRVPAAAAVADPLTEEALSCQRAVLRLPPGADRFRVIDAAARQGPALIVVPSPDEAAQLAGRLRRAGGAVAAVPNEWARAAGGGVTVVGTRSAALSPVPGLASVVVLDGHDDRHTSQSAPTWNAWVVAAERARRAGVPCVVVSPTPTLELLEWGTLVAPTRADERAGWPPLEVIDRRADDPRTGLYSERLVSLLRSDRRVLFILNRKGRGILLACGTCRELARCERCDGAMSQDEAELRCRRCGATRPVVCVACGSNVLKRLRIGVTRAREELEALAGATVGEVTGDSDDLPEARLIVGTEALLFRVSDADAVVFIDFDQELLAPRISASEHALGLLARAGRAVGGRRRQGRVVVQTRLPDHPVIAAALHADPSRATDADRTIRASLGLPPFSAMAFVSGEAAADFVDGLRTSLTGVDIQGPAEGVWRLRAADHQTLCDALAAAARPPGRVRIEVDPRRA